MRYSRNEERDVSMKGLGKHLIVELYGCKRQLIDDLNHIKTVMIKAATMAKATVISHDFHKFAPHGVTGVLILAESHFAIHTWPEFGYCAVDLFTCGDLTDNDAALDIIKTEFEAQHYSASQMVRGILNIPKGELVHKPKEPELAFA